MDFSTKFLTTESISSRTKTLRLILTELQPQQIFFNKYVCEFHVFGWDFTKILSKKINDDGDDEQDQNNDNNDDENHVRDILTTKTLPNLSAPATVS